MKILKLEGYEEDFVEPLEEETEHVDYDEVKNTYVPLFKKALAAAKKDNKGVIYDYIKCPHKLSKQTSIPGSQPVFELHTGGHILVSRQDPYKGAYSEFKKTLTKELKKVNINLKSIIYRKCDTDMWGSRGSCFEVNCFVFTIIE